MYFAHVDILTQDNGNALNVTISNSMKIVQITYQLGAKENNIRNLILKNHTCIINKNALNSCSGKLKIVWQIIIVVTLWLITVK